MSPNTEASHSQVKNEARTNKLPKSKDRAGAQQICQNLETRQEHKNLPKSTDRAGAQQSAKIERPGRNTKHLPKSKDRAGANLQTHKPTSRSPQTYKSQQPTASLQPTAIQAVWKILCTITDRRSLCASNFVTQATVWLNHELAM